MAKQTMNFQSAYNKQFENIRETEFPNLKGTTYVDHVGTTLYSRSQIEAYHKDLLSNLYGNPHSRSQSSRLSTDLIDQVRYRILKHFNTNPDKYSVVFTSGCTAALKLIAETFTFDLEAEDTSDLETSQNDLKPSQNDLKPSQNDLANSDSDLANSYSKIEPSQINNTKLENKQNITSKKSDYHGDQTTDRKGCFCYLLDNHTSVQGMREIAVDKAGSILCLDEHELNTEVTMATHVFKHKQYKHGGNCLFVYPAQSNFSGRKYPFKWIKMVQDNELTFQGYHQGHWYVGLDAAAYVCTSQLDLDLYSPDFVTLSFYKMFGMPTGLGALLVRNESAAVLKKKYFGGGAVAVSSAKEMFHVLRPLISDGFEDGTVSFLDIIALRHGFDVLERLGGGMERISIHTFCITQYFYHKLSSYHHGNGQQLAKIYGEDNYESAETQGAIVNFNLMRMDGSFIGFAEVDKMAQLYDVHLRTGCFCNIGACQKYLGLSSEQIRNNYEAGHVCGDDRDLIDGKPTGSVRISFGYMSTISDAQRCLQFIGECFLEGIQNKSDFIQNIIQTTAESKFETSSLRSVKTDQSNCTDFSSKEHGAVLSNQNISSGAVLSNQNISSDDVLSNQNISSEPLNKQYEISHDSVARGFDQSDCSFHMDMDANKMEVDHIIQSCTGDNRRLTNIYLYPVKSCGAFQVSEWEIGPRGLLYDREWMIVSESGVTLSQKREPRLCLLKPHIDLGRHTLFLDFPDMETFQLPLNSSHAYGDTDVRMSCTSKVCGDRVNGIDCGDEVSDWLSEALQRPGCRLVQQTKQDDRQTKLADSIKAQSSANTNISLANESQFLLISRSSIKALQNKMAEKLEGEECFEDIDNLIGRFRGNLIIGGGESFDEDTWNSLQIGDNKFISQGGCSRCQMICLDQTTGERSREPLSTLAAWRGRKIPFGIHLRLDNSCHGNNIRIGDKLTTF